MPAGWNVRVTTFDSEGKPGHVRYFLAYESDKERAVEMVRKRVPVNKGGGGRSCRRGSRERICWPKHEAGRRKTAWLNIPSACARAQLVKLMIDIARWLRSSTATRCGAGRWLRYFTRPRHRSQLWDSASATVLYWAAV